MAMNDSSSNTPRIPVTRKPYEKPAFRYEQVFVTTALSCGKIEPTSAACQLSSKS